ncbi:MAG TPA: hypothetical protein QF480_00810 [Bacteroidales bacterium]|jgi:hypothetical protein|nr:hypothetical protein [Bacteroidota bacterium]HJN05130.1 hypothetical protein [Bacteroidales bacterium]|tara:strand:+ start:505 stop:888 length:384 start_codon:yes stop_codon:yes gene_type:complete
MKSKIAPFVVGFSYYSGIIFFLSLAVQLWIPDIEISNTWPFILLFIYGFTLFAFTMLVKYIDTKLSHFANAFMLVNFGKLILFSIIIIVYAWLVRDDAISFTVTFFVYYLMLTTYEIIALLKIPKGS